VTLILASGSPQRRAILEALGVEFEVRAVDVVEDGSGPAVAVARENALRKALAGRRDEADLVLGVDTVVALDGELFGKPADAAAAAATLRRLGGRTHEVVSGFALVDAEGVRAGVDVTLVSFRELDDVTIAWYVGCGEWQGRAGGYAIQGRGGALVRRIEGDYLNVVGLPVAALLDAGLALLAGG
jgi:septum formation protein